MLTSLLYHGYGLTEQIYLKTSYVNDTIIFDVETKEDKLRCPNCNSYNVIQRGRKERKFKAPPICRKKVIIRIKIQRLGCKDCGRVRQEKLCFADSKKSYIKNMKHYIIDLSEVMTIQDIANHLGMQWDTIKEIQKDALAKKYGKPDLSKVKYIAIDEIAVKKGHNYQTIVMDLRSGAVIFVGDGKDAASLKPFWKRLKRSGAKIEAVAMDMSVAYIDAVEKNLSNSQIVFDHFHIVKMYNDKLTDLRREVYNNEKDADKKNSKRHALDSFKEHRKP